jgi:hypothetical protein
MQIPTQYIGRWIGEITDVTVKPYKGMIVLTANSVSSTYYMAQKIRTGEISLLSASDASIVMKEDADSFNGTLVLSMNVDESLECVWRKGKRLTNKVSAQSVMRRDND